MNKGKCAECGAEATRVTYKIYFGGYVRTLYCETHWKDKT